MPFFFIDTSLVCLRTRSKRVHLLLKARRKVGFRAMGSVIDSWIGIGSEVSKGSYPIVKKRILTWACKLYSRKRKL